MHATTSTAANTSGTTRRVRHARRPTPEIFGTKSRCFVLSMAGPSLSSSPGMSRNTVSMLIKIALMSTMPRSRPRPNFMNVMATRPAMVVRLEELMTVMDFSSDSMTASRTGSVSCACL